MNVLVVGELNADLIYSGFDSLPQPGREVLAKHASLELGSSSAICAAGLARLGTPVSFLGRTGADLLGAFCINELTRAGVDTTLVNVCAALETGITASFSSEDRALVTFPGSITALTADEISSAVLGRFTHLHVSSYYLQSGLRPGLAGLFNTARKLGLTVSLDPGYDPAEQWSHAIFDVLREGDIFLLNRVELAALSGTGDVPAGLRAVSGRAEIVVVKLGPQGCAASVAGRLYTAPPIKIDALDTTGAGDCFNAGFLHAWLQGYGIEDCLECGSICGGLSTRTLGGCGSQATWPEVERMMQEPVAAARMGKGC